MAKASKPTKPIQVFLDTKQFIQRESQRSGGGNKDFFAGNNKGFIRHKEKMQQQMADVAEIMERQEQAGGFVIVQMREDALAKSYRPITLFSPNNSFGLVGGGDIGEMFYQCTPQAFHTLSNIVEKKAEHKPRLAKNKTTGDMEERVSSYRSELGGIDNIRLPEAADKIKFSASDAIEWLQKPNVLGGYVVELYRPDWNTHPTVVRQMFIEFRNTLELFGGLIAVPVFREKKRSHGLMAISIDLIEASFPSYVQLPMSGETPIQKSDTTDPSQDGRSFPERDFTIERHQHLIDLLAKEPLVRCIDLPLLLESPSSNIEQGADIEFPLPEKNKDYPIVGIVDGGIADVSPLSEWCAGTNDIVGPDDRDYSHGTFIAGLVSGGRRLNPHIDATIERDGCRFYDLVLMPRAGMLKSYYPTPDEFFDQLDTAVQHAKDNNGVRVFNLSLGSPHIRNALGYSIFAKALDEIAREHDVIFVVSAGNLAANTRPTWPKEGERAVEMLASHASSDIHITAPAEHMLGLSVGAINPPGIDGHEPDVPTTYTRRGPGAGGARKPELCHYGGVSPRGGSKTGLYSLAPDGTVIDGNGTSYAAPSVAASIATIDHRLGNMAPRETLLALPVHHAQRPTSMQAKALRHITRDYIGFGMAPPADTCLADSPHSVTLVFSETLHIKRELNFDFSWPRSLVTENDKCKGQVDLTLAYTPPIDAEFGAECLRVRLEASLYQLEINEETGEEKSKSHLKPYDTDLSQDSQFTEEYLLKTGLKWTPIKRYNITMPKGRGSSSTWRLSLKSFNRASAMFPEEGVPFTLIMTIRDLEDKAPIYEEVRAEILSRGLQIADVTVAHRIKTRT